ncbi:hypothetical protein PR048_033316 [Dryococelus australis]|uniref:Uncharacterized protein n=1 Tax=Dryococelus australis TaxID=614101 RepID=A0ABQ9FZY5_9NEOP|nr:hypothetical protein PR048_033316 [Dryococelus australis]
MSGRVKREIPEKAHRPTASSGTIPTFESPVTRPGIEPGSPWWEASRLTSQPPLPLSVSNNHLHLASSIFSCHCDTSLPSSLSGVRLLPGVSSEQPARSQQIKYKPPLRLDLPPSRPHSGPVAVAGFFAGGAILDLLASCSSAPSADEPETLTRFDGGLGSAPISQKLAPRRKKRNVSPAVVVNMCSPEWVNEGRETLRFLTTAPATAPRAGSLLRGMPSQLLGDGSSILDVSNRPFHRTQITVWCSIEQEATDVTQSVIFIGAAVNRVQFPAGPPSGFRHVGIVLDDAAGRRVFSGISSFPVLAFRHWSIRTSLHPLASSPKTSKYDPPKSLHISLS